MGGGPRGARRGPAPRARGENERLAGVSARNVRESSRWRPGPEQHPIASWDIARSRYGVVSLAVFVLGTPLAHGDPSVPGGAPRTDSEITAVTGALLPTHGLTCSFILQSPEPRTGGAGGSDRRPRACPPLGARRPLTRGPGRRVPVLVVGCWS